MHFSEITIASLEKKNKKKELLQENAEIASLVKEIKSLQAQIAYLKDICSIYQEDSDKANKKADFYQNEYVAMEKNHELELIKINEAEIIKEKQHQEEILKLVNE